MDRNLTLPKRRGHQSPQDLFHRLFQSIMQKPIFCALLCFVAGCSSERVDVPATETPSPPAVRTIAVPSPPRSIEVHLPPWPEGTSFENASLVLQKEMFGHFPDEIYPELAPRFLALHAVLKSYWSERAELFEELRGPIPETSLPPDCRKQVGEIVRREMQANFVCAWSAFSIAPVGFEPAETESYWNDSAEELFYLLDCQIAFYETNREKLQTARRELKEPAQSSLNDRIASVQRDHGYYFANMLLPLQCFYLSEKQKKRLLDGETRFRNARLDPYATLDRWNRHNFHSAVLTPVNPFGDTTDPDAVRFLAELRQHERAAWKVDKTPGLAALNIGENDLLRWDGSTSLRPFADLLVSHLTGVPYRNRTGAHFGMAISAHLFFFEPGNEHKPSEHPLVVKWCSHLFSQTHGSINKVIAGECDLAFATRMPSPDELAAAETKKVELVCTPFAKDALVFIDHRANPVKGLTTEQLRDIFSGGVKQWSDVGGRAAPIELLVRNANSGSQELMKTLVMKDREMPKEVQHDIIPAMIGPFSRLEKNPNAIGYSVYYYEHYMAINAFARAMAVDGVPPSAETIESGKYPLVYDAVLVHRKEPGEKVEAFARWLLSDEGQRVVRESGYVPIREIP